MNIFAHTFTTEAEALAAVELINLAQGIPVDADSETQNWQTAKEYADGWYIEADAVTAATLVGNIPTTITTIDL